MIFDRELGAGARGWAVTYRPHGRPWQPGERGPAPRPRGNAGTARGGGRRDLYAGELAARQAAGLAAAGAGSRPPTWRPTPRPGRRRSPSTTGARSATTHPPNSSASSASRSSTSSRRWSRPTPPPSSRATAARRPAPTCAGPTSGSRPRSGPRLIEAPTCRDPAFVDVPVERLLDAAYGECARRRPTLPAPPAPRRRGRRPAAARSGSGSWIRRATRSAYRIRYAGFGSGVVDPATGIAYQNRGSYFSLDPDHPNVLAAASAPCTPSFPGCSSGMGGRGSCSEHGRRRPTRDLRPARPALVDGGSTWPRPSRRRAGPGSAGAFRPARCRSDRAALPARAARRPCLDGTPPRRPDPFDGALGHAHAIELVAGGPALGGTLAAATDPRSPGLAAAW